MATVSYGSYRSLRWRSDTKYKVYAILHFSLNSEPVNPSQAPISFYNVPQPYQMAL
ncbi:hypothetical protein Hanom_Chr07g00669631 [Helianthus anomalus]